MRSVLIVLGIAAVALVLSVVLTKRRDLSPAPQDDAFEKQMKEQAADMAAARAKALKSQSAPAGAGKGASSAGATGATTPEKFASPREGIVTAVMSVKDRGDVTIELYPKAAPQTVAQFTRLIKSKFYDGILFHRVVPNFVVQAGDPASKTYTPQDVAAKDDGQGGTQGLGARGSGHNIPFETDSLTNVPGALAMALSGARSDTADSQFFINLNANPNLDGDYCVFGKVVQGMDVVNKIQRGDVITRFAVK